MYSKVDKLFFKPTKPPSCTEPPQTTPSHIEPYQTTKDQQSHTKQPQITRNQPSHTGHTTNRTKPPQTLSVLWLLNLRALSISDMGPSGRRVGELCGGVQLIELLSVVRLLPLQRCSTRLHQLLRGGCWLSSKGTAMCEGMMRNRN